jgi:hypothetical protein
MLPAEIVDKLSGLPWNEPEHVQVLIKPMWEWLFELWMFRDGELSRIA